MKVVKTHQDFAARARALARQRHGENFNSEQLSKCQDELFKRDGGKMFLEGARDTQPRARRDRPNAWRAPRVRTHQTFAEASRRLAIEKHGANYTDVQLARAQAEILKIAPHIYMNEMDAHARVSAEAPNNQLEPILDESEDSVGVDEPDDDGMVACTGCNGTGELPDGEECEECDGSGRVEQQRQSKNPPPPPATQPNKQRQSKSLRSLKLDALLRGVERGAIARSDASQEVKRRQHSPGWSRFFNRELSAWQRKRVLSLLGVA